MNDIVALWGFRLLKIQGWAKVASKGKILVREESYVNYNMVIFCALLT